jgi:hypothetical protein
MMLLIHTNADEHRKDSERAMQNSFLNLLSEKISLLEKDPLQRYQVLSAVLFIFLSVSLAKFFATFSPSAAADSAAVCSAHPHPQRKTSAPLIQFFTILFSIFSVWIFRQLSSIFCREASLYLSLKQQTTEEDVSHLEYFMYRVDFYWSSDRRFKSFVLISVIVFLILVGGLFWMVFVGDQLSESFWISWTFLADPGTHANHTGFVQRVISFVMTIGGMIVFAFVIGIVSEDLSEFVDKLREGKSRVIVTNHTLILGQVCLSVSASPCLYVFSSHPPAGRDAPLHHPADRFGKSESRGRVHRHLIFCTQNHSRKAH